MSVSPWKTIDSAQKDGTPVLLRLKNPIPDRPDLDSFAGIAFVGRHAGSDWGWNFAAPVGMGGFPDEWMVGWMPLPEAPVTCKKESQP